MGNRNVTCNVKIFTRKTRKLEKAVVRALEQTAEELHTDLQQSQRMPYKTGNLQNDSTFVDCSESQSGRVYLASDTPYARRLYFHPEYHFDQTENPNAGGKWLEDYLPGGRKEDFAQNAFNRIYKKEADL